MEQTIFKRNPLGSRFSWIFPLQILVIIFAALSIYGPVLHGAWLMDDDLYLTRNPLLADPARLWKAWFEPGSFMEYYPIQESLQWMQWQLWHADTFGYHATNLVLHVISALLVWRLLAKLGLQFAWLGGLLFTVHPTMVESVAWIAEFKNTLSLPPFLLAMIYYVDYEQDGQWRNYLVALGFFLVAMMCKISMASFPFVILLYGWWRRGRIGWSDVKAGLPFLFISLGLGLLSLYSGIWYVQSHHLVPWPIPPNGFFARWAVAGLSIAFYFWNCVWPFGLLPVYPQWKVNPPSVIQFLPWLVLGGILYGFWIQRHTWGRHALLGLGFFLILLGPFVTINVGGYTTFTWVMDHFLYIPIIGLIGLTVAVLEKIADRLSLSLRWYGSGILLVVLGLLTWESHAYAGLFTSQESLWTYTVRHNPEAWPAHNNLGNIYYEKGELELALQEYVAAVKLNPYYSASRCSMGYIRLVRGDLNGALEEYNQAINRTPDKAQAYYGRAQVEQARGDWDQAFNDLLMVSRIAPYSAYADYSHLLIWRVRIAQNRPAQADQELSVALAQGWNSPPNAWITQVARFLIGQTDESSLLAAARSPIPEADNEQLCEAWYFAGIKRLAVHDSAGATGDFQKCLATNQRTCVQYVLAQTELERM